MKISEGKSDELCSGVVEAPSYTVEEYIKAKCDCLNGYRLVGIDTIVVCQKCKDIDSEEE